MLLAVDRFPPLIGRMLNLDFGIIKPQYHNEFDVLYRRLKYLSPLHYIGVASSNSSQIALTTMIFFLYFICAGILFTHIGIRKIEKMDL